MNNNQLFIALFIMSAINMVGLMYLVVHQLRSRRLHVAQGSILLDSSALMDGRIIDVASTGVLTADLIVPRSVIREMQLLADKADHEKRDRARAGLDNIAKLQAMDVVSVNIVNDGLVDAGGVDERLLALAQKYQAAIATVDYNLNKVARTISVTVINVNELAQLLRAKLIPGEQADIKLIQEGSSREQAVGYSDDGTMIVVENGKHFVGQTVKIEVVRLLQTEAGRMIFANIVPSKEKPAKTNRTTAKTKVARSVSSKTTRKSIAAVKPQTTAGWHSDGEQKNADPKANTLKSAQPAKPRARSIAQTEQDLVRLANQ